ncbi:MAG: hypothetical protein SFX18_16700 [Pirellulales bacterium]|nr:hypothetical protein [Pirellulales bacterium]
MQLWKINQIDSSMFELFDRNEDFYVSQGNLPHWYQPGVTYFITFRTADSVPQTLNRAWHARREQWLRHHNIDPKSKNWKEELHHEPDLRHEYNKLFTKEFMDYLDRGYGDCQLKDPDFGTYCGDDLEPF